MKVKPSYFLIVLLTLSHTVEAIPVLNRTDLIGLSKQKQNQLERYETCYHFAGEISGDPNLDGYVKQRMKEERCNTIVSEITKLRKSNKHNRRVLALIDKIESEYGYRLGE